ncbi:MAG: flagellar hook-basal body complex protein, partial [Peptococcaceae bacterium]|nr:flagellar hook-basal body complex protein [Peptococcaceae bacterium]
MIRSLYSGASGMKNHQIRMDVISNNIANVNTTGFKSSRANFEDMLVQTLRSPSGPSEDSDLGSINPSQVGTGVGLASIHTDMEQGAMQSTGRSLDLAIEGNGFFQVSDGTNTFYTRSGVFYIDAEGFLVDGNGYKLGDEIEIGTDVGTINIAVDGTITVFDTDGQDLEVNLKIGLYSFANQEGLARAGHNYFQETDASGEAKAIEEVGTSSKINSKYLEMSNVNLTDEFVNMITTQRGYQASGRAITTSDQMLME